MLKKHLLTVAIALPLSSLALAVPQQQGQGQAQQGQAQQGQAQQSALPGVLQWPATDNDSLEALRQTCVELKNNQQVRSFDLKVACTHQYEDWERHSGTFNKENLASLGANMYMKGVQTNETRIESINDTQKLQCSVYEQYRITTPAIPVAITDCDQLTQDALTEICRKATANACASAGMRKVGGQKQQGQQGQQQGQQGQAQQQQGQQQQQQAPAGAECVKETLQVVNTCTNY